MALCSQLCEWLLPLIARLGWAKIMRRPPLDEFDMPILDAIRNILSTEANSYGGQLLAERTAFNEIHKLMCSGKLAVVGAEIDFEPSMLIKPKKCKQLFPHEIIVPRNRTAPNGYVFALIDRRDSDDKIRYYRALRVRSKQFCKHWPKANEAAKR